MEDPYNITLEGTDYVTCNSDLVPVGDVEVEVEHVVRSVVTKLAVLVLDL